MNTSALFTDFYQITMAYSYWKTGKAEQEAVFNLFFRKNPFGGKYVISCGLKFALEYINSFSLTPDDFMYLDSLNLFEEEFLDYLYALRLSVDVDAMPEGTIVFPNEPILSVKGSLIQCQLLETVLLNIINFNSLIATKASRICHAAKGRPVLEFGLRRAQGPDGGLSASRAAYIGGCSATSNVLAGKTYNIPVKGTIAHSWVMSFDTELEAFKAYAKAMPDNCILLVDTYDVIQGIKNAITVGNEILRPNGKDLLGIRLDSGSLDIDSIIARSMLNQAGFADTVIVGSNDLDEHEISKFIPGHKLDAFGVGTNLITAKDDPALGGVYKLSSLRSLKSGEFENKIKYSKGKTTLPGELQVTRTFCIEDGKVAQRDIIHFKKDVGTIGSRLLHNVIENGRLVKPDEGLFIIKERVKKEVKYFNRIMGINNSSKYEVSIDKSVKNEQLKLIKSIKENISGRDTFLTRKGR